MVNKLEDPSVAYAYAGFDHNFTLFKGYTRQLRDSVTGELGRFEQDFKGYLPEVENDSDPVGWLKRAVRQRLVAWCKATETQPEFWVIEFSPALAKFVVPSHLYLDRATDRAWLA